jgi:hypothetical protein
VRLTDEERLFIYRAYEVFPHGHELEGRRRFKRASTRAARASRRPSWRLARDREMDPDGPVRCDGWREWDGVWVPVGGPVLDPYIPVIATVEEQAEDLAYGAMKAILENCELGNRYDIGEERIMHRDAPGGSRRSRLAERPRRRTHDVRVVRRDAPVRR